MPDRPILFSRPMVRALLAGTKTQTRRVLKPQPGQDGVYGSIKAAKAALKIVTGGRLWVRETWARGWELDGSDQPAGAEQTYYRADGEPFSRWDNGDGTFRESIPWAPSIFMPRWASRITLTVTDVRVQRLQEISEEDARAEGIEFADGYWVRANAHLGEDTGDLIPNNPPAAAFHILWNSINGPGAWEANPWVAAYTFTVEHRNIDAALSEGGR